MIFLCALLGAFISRWHGGGFISGTPKVLKNIAWALPFGLCTAFTVLPYTTTFVAILLGATAFILCLLGKATGHGLWFNFGKAIKYIVPEALDFLLVPFFGRDPRTEKDIVYYNAISRYGVEKLWWRCFAGLAVVGFAAVSGAAIIIGFFNPLLSAFIALGGLLKPVAYVIGRYSIPAGYVENHNFDEPTEWGEFFTGFFAYAGLGVSCASLAISLISVLH